MKRKQVPLENEEKRGELGFDLFNKVKLNEQKRRELFAENMGHLEKILDSGLYRDILGDEKATWPALLGQLEVFYTRSEVIQHIRARKKLRVWEVADSALEGIPLNRIIQISVLARDKEHVETLLSQAKTLANREWSDEMSKLKGHHHIEDGHEHKFKEFKQCELCALREAVKSE